MIGRNEIINKKILLLQYTIYKNLNIVRFQNIIILSYINNNSFCPSCLIFYNINLETFNLIDKKTSDNFSRHNMIYSEIDSLLSSEDFDLLNKSIPKLVGKNDIMLIDLESKYKKLISSSETYNHFFCNCDTYKNTSVSQNIGDYSIIKSVENMNEEILKYFNHSFFLDNSVYFTYFYNPLSFLNDNFFETDLGIGISTSNDIALKKSITESIERYALFLPQYKKNIKEIDINAFCIVNDDSFKFQMASSNGFAAASNKEMAIQNSYNELLERHSIMHTWIYGNNTNLVDVTSLPQKFIDYISELKNIGFQTYIFNIINKGGIYCFLVITVNKDKEPFIKTGVGSHHLYKDEALNKAFGELLIGIYFDFRFPINDEQHGADFHLNYYRTHKDSLLKLDNFKSLLKSSLILWDNIEKKPIQLNTIYFDFSVKHIKDFYIIKASQEKFFPLYFKGFKKTWCDFYFNDFEQNLLLYKIHPFP